MSTTNGLPRRRFSLAMREALLVLAAGTGLGLAHGALTDDRIFQTTAAPSAAASLEERAAMPDSPMMVSVSEAEELFRAGQALFVDARSEFDYGLGHIKGALNLPLKSAVKGADLLPDVPRDRTVVVLDRLANTAAATIPIGLDEAIRTGRLRPGMVVLLTGFGAGLTWGSAALRWS